MDNSTAISKVKAAKVTAISNEEIVAALLSHNTLAEAAEACGIGRRTLYDRMDTLEFKAEYEAARGDILRAAVNNLNGHIASAIDTIAEIMTDREANPATRLQACQTLLNTAEKFTGRLEASERSTIFHQSEEAARMAELFTL